MRDVDIAKLQLMQYTNENMQHSTLMIKLVPIEFSGSG